MGFCNACEVYVAQNKSECASGHPVSDTAAFNPNPMFNLAPASKRAPVTEGAPVTQGALALDAAPSDSPEAGTPPPPPELVPPPPSRRVPVRNIVVGVVAAVLAAAGVRVGILRPAGGDDGRLVRHLAAGSSHPYRLSASISVDVSGAGQRSKEAFWIRYNGAEKILAINPRGVATIRYTVDGVTAKRNGKTVALPPPRGLALEAHVASRGAMTGEPRAFGDQTFGGRLIDDWLTPADVIPFLSLDPVKEGSTWTHTLKEPIPGLTRETLVTYNYRYTPPAADAETYALRATSTTPVKIDLSPSDLSDLVGRDVGLATGRYDATVTTTTDYTVDQATGRVRRADAHTKGTIKITFTAARTAVLTMVIQSHGIYEA